MKKYLPILCLCILAGCVQTQAPISREIPTAPAQEELPEIEHDEYIQDDSQQVITHKLYEVLPSDNLMSIARANDVSTGSIIKLNNLRKPYYLKPGTLIKVPVYTTQYTAESKVIHIKPSTKTETK